MRSAVQSCVPLQESTAICCAFLYILTSSRSGLDVGSGTCELAHKWTWSNWQKTNEVSGCQYVYRKENQCILRFLGYNATGQKGLEGVASRRLKHPASRYLKIKHLRKFRECFFLSWEHWGNTNYFIFHKNSSLNIFCPKKFHFHPGQRINDDHI